ncbi:MAG: hypothetical protein MUE49_10255 [Rhodospirillales bacterium]|jgi:hypothetical protein|nr:hypothetical protein [Rhodospirillales bacterium]
MKMIGPILAIGGAAVIGASIAFTAYHSDPERSPERRWALNYQKGTYLGRTQPPLSQQTELQLRDRALYQAGPSSSGFAMSTSSFGLTGADVRPPAQPYGTPIAVSPSSR